MISKDEAGEENLSDNSHEDLRIENEILKLKMRAEHGAFFGIRAAGDLQIHHRRII